MYETKKTETVRLGGLALLTPSNTKPEDPQIQTSNKNTPAAKITHNTSRLATDANAESARDQRRTRTARRRRQIRFTTLAFVGRSLQGARLRFENALLLFPNRTP